MNMPKLGVPSVQSVVNLVIALVIILAVVRLFAPEGIKSWFRV
jgi:hypothetical protein